MTEAPTKTMNAALSKVVERVHGPAGSHAAPLLAGLPIAGGSAPFPDQVRDRNRTSSAAGPLAPVDSEKLLEAFRRFGARPQFFSDALANALSPLPLEEGRFEDQLLDAGGQRQIEDESQMESEFKALLPIEQAVLWRLLDLQGRFRPCDGEALRFYREQLPAFGQPANTRVTAQMAQAAVEAIRQRTPALVLKSARGEYSVDDANMHIWYAKRIAAGTWPPKGSEPDEARAGTQTHV